MGVVGTAPGGGKVTVEGLRAEVVKSGSTVTVRQGSRVVQQVAGTLPAGGSLVQSTNGFGNLDGSGRWNNYFERVTGDAGTVSGGKFIVGKSGKYRISMHGYAHTNANTKMYLYVDSAYYEAETWNSFSGVRHFVLDKDIQLTAGQQLSLQIWYGDANVNQAVATPLLFLMPL